MLAFWWHCLSVFNKGIFNFSILQCKREKVYDLSLSHKTSPTPPLLWERGWFVLSVVLWSSPRESWQHHLFHTFPATRPAQYGLVWHGSLLLISVKSTSLSLLSHADSLRDSKTSLAPSTMSLMVERGIGCQTTLSGTEFQPAMEELEEALALSNLATPKHGKRLHIPVVRILDAQVILVY